MSGHMKHICLFSISTLLLACAGPTDDHDADGDRGTAEAASASDPGIPSSATSDRETSNDAVHRGDVGPAALADERGDRDVDPRLERSGDGLPEDVNDLDELGTRAASATPPSGAKCYRRNGSGTVVGVPCSTPVRTHEVTTSGTLRNEGFGRCLAPSAPRLTSCSSSPRVQRKGTVTDYWQCVRLTPPVGQLVCIYTVGTVSTSHRFVNAEGKCLEYVGAVRWGACGSTAVWNVRGPRYYRGTNSYLTTSNGIDLGLRVYSAPDNNGETVWTFAP